MGRALRTTKIMQNHVCRFCRDLRASKTIKNKRFPFLLDPTGDGHCQKQFVVELVGTLQATKLIYLLGFEHQEYASKTSHEKSDPNMYGKSMFVLAVRG